MLQAALCLIALAAPAALSAQAIAAARPGLVYYGEGVVILYGERKPSGKVGMMYWEPGKPVETANGRAELLMGANATLRIDRGAP